MRDMKSKPTPSRPLETRVHKRARRDSIQNALLSTLLVAGALPVALAAPKVLSLLSLHHIDALIPRNPKQRIHETAARLKRKGLIEFRNENGRKRMRITAAGKEKIRLLEEEALARAKPKRWDGRWRIVMFDIPEQRKVLRNRVRTLVRRIGFVHFQHSVWVYPYDSEELIALIKSELKVGRDIVYLVADAIEFDRPLRERFALPPSD